jgi:hypothetical protein
MSALAIAEHHPIATRTTAAVHAEGTISDQHDRAGWAPPPWLDRTCQDLYKLLAPHANQRVEESCMLALLLRRIVRIDTRRLTSATPELPLDNSARNFGGDADTIDNLHELSVFACNSDIRRFGLQQLMSRERIERTRVLNVNAT